MGVHLERARLLLAQSRLELAEQELRQELVAQPESFQAHALLGLCLAQREQFAEATQAAQTAIHHAPDHPLPHYMLAAVLQRRGRPDEAEAAIAEAIRLDPEDPNNFSLLSATRFDRRRWAEALAAAEAGLALDPEHVDCVNLRAMALVKLGRKELAGSTIDSALARNPDNAETHANQGWTLLERGKPDEAMRHFREALRLNPESDWARAGIVESLKARHFIYRWMLAYFLWMARLSERAQWALVIGGYVGFRVLNEIARLYPRVAPFVWPLIIAYIVFAVMTWIAQPLFDLLLRLHPFGRHALSRKQVVASNWLGACLLAMVALVITGLATGRGVYLLAAIMAGLLTLPLTAIFRCHRGWPRNWMIGITVGVAALGAGSVVPWMIADELPQHVANFTQTCQTLFLLAAFLSQFAANYFIHARPRR